MPFKPIIAKISNLSLVIVIPRRKGIEHLQTLNLIHNTRYYNVLHLWEKYRFKLSPILLGFSLIILSHEVHITRENGQYMITYIVLENPHMNIFYFTCTSIFSNLVFHAKNCNCLNKITDYNLVK